MMSEAQIPLSNGDQHARLTQHIHQLFQNFGFQEWPESTACSHPDTAKCKSRSMNPFKSKWGNKNTSNVK